MEKIKTLYRNDHEEHSSQGQPQTFHAMATTNFPQSDTLQVKLLILVKQTDWCNILGSPIPIN